jgi:hypothetical protein
VAYCVIDMDAGQRFDRVEQKLDRMEQTLGDLRVSMGKLEASPHPDVEGRLRGLERKIYAIPSLSVILAAAGIAVAIWSHAHPA